MLNGIDSPVRAASGGALQLRGLAKTYRDSWGRRVTALRDVSFAVRRGEVFGLLGPNGAGKSTTFKIVLGLLRSSAGEGTLLGAPLGSLEARRRIGFLPENPYFYDYLTARELLDTCATLCGVPSSGRDRLISASLERVGLEATDRRRLRKYSKGMLQRVGMAQALLHDPEFVILDEPMSGLDPAGRRLFRDLILGLKEEGKTVLFASHVLPDVEALCDRVAILVEGVVRRVGRVDELVHPESAGYEVEAVDVPSALIEAWSRRFRVRSAGGRTLVRTGAEEPVEPVVGQIASVGGRLLAVRPVQASLEDVFLTEAAGGDRPGRIPHGMDGHERGAA